MRTREASTCSAVQLSSSAMRRTETPASRRRNALRSRSNTVDASSSGIISAVMEAASRADTIPEQVTIADRKGLVAAVRPALAARRRFKVTLRGPMASGKTTMLAELATEAAREWGMSIAQFGLV